jgi:hypothetical protein
LDLLVIDVVPDNLVVAGATLSEQAGAFSKTKLLADEGCS